MKKAAIGFKYSVLAAIETDTETAYKSKAPIRIPYAAEMTKNDKSSENEIFADDDLYANVKNSSGFLATITYREMDLKLASEIGSGDYDAETNELAIDYTEENKPYMLGYIEPLIEGGACRTVQILSTELNSIDMIGSPKTKENGVTVRDVAVALTCKRPNLLGQKPMIIREHASQAAAITYINTPLTLPKS